MKKIIVLICICSFIVIACSETSNPNNSISNIDNDKDSVNVSEVDDSDKEKEIIFTGPIGIKGVDEEKVVGDIVFIDGTATPYSEDLELSDEQKSVAIAIIFYKGTELNTSWDDVSIERTLGVGLKHSENSLSWCTLDIYQKLATTNLMFRSIECPVTQEDDNSFSFTKDRNGSDNFECINEYFVNTDNLISKFPAFSFAKNYSEQEGSRVNGTIYSEGWYLPSIAELYHIYACCKDTENGVDINAISIFLGGDSFVDSYYSYWSSSTNDKDTYDLDMRGIPYESRPQPRITRGPGANDNLVCVIHEF